MEFFLLPANKSNFFYSEILPFLLGVLDVIMMFGAYSTTRRLAVARIFLRFTWFSAASVVISVLYVYVFYHCLILCSVTLFPRFGVIVFSVPYSLAKGNLPSWFDDSGKRFRKRVNEMEILLYSDCTQLSSPYMLASNFSLVSSCEYLPATS